MSVRESVDGLVRRWRNLAAETEGASTPAKSKPAAKEASQAESAGLLAMPRDGGFKLLLVVSESPGLSALMNL